MPIYDGAQTVSGRADGTTPIPQFYAVVKTGTDNWYEAVNAADELVAGFVQERVTDSEQSITVVKGGRTKAIAGGVLDENDPVTVDSVGRVVEAKGVATVTSGANTSLDYTETDAGRGKISSITYVNDGASVTGWVELIGSTLIAHLSTNGGGAITETADSLKVLLAAHAEIAAFITAADSAGHDGSGTLTAEIAVRLTGATNIIGRALEAASGAGSEIDIWIERGA